MQNMDGIVMISSFLFCADKYTHTYTHEQTDGRTDAAIVNKCFATRQGGTLAINE